MKLYSLPSLKLLERLDAIGVHPSRIQQEKYQYILHLIIKDHFTNKNKRLKSFTQLYTPTLQRILHSKFCKKVIQDLITCEIIVRSKGYTKGLSYGYKIIEKWKHEDVVMISASSTLSERCYRYFAGLEEKQISLKGEQTGETEALQKLRKVYKEETYFDWTKASTYIERLYFLKEINEKKYKRYLFMIEHLRYSNSPERYFKFGRMGNRLHTLITILPSCLRQFLSFKHKEGETLYNIDVKNSQPLTLNLIIRKEGLENSDLLRKEDVLLYRELTEKGIFYEYIMKEFPAAAKEYNLKDLQYTSRKACKISTFRFFYGRYRKEPLYADEMIFKIKFPNVYEVMQKYKQISYNHLPCLMQQYEAELFIDNVAINLVKKNCYILTIHDSCLTTEDYSDEVVNEIKRQYSLKNLSPMIKKEKVKEDFQEIIKKSEEVLSKSIFDVKQ